MIRVLLPLLLCVLAFAAGAQSVHDQRSSADADPPALSAGHPQRPLSNRDCLRGTGSMITASSNARADARGDRAPRKCAPTTGRAYDRDEIERTGETNIADALRKLDPSVH